jgi:16S rRNA U1498 N3-methylase RsmE
VLLQRDQARVYAKPIVDGRSSLELSPEELAAPVPRVRLVDTVLRVETAAVVAASGVLYAR